MAGAHQRVSAVAEVGRAHLPRAGALPAVDLDAVLLRVLAALGLARQGVAEAAVHRNGKTTCVSFARR
eukprot:6186108-Pleurochrysis_carterae.AAC.1